MHYLQLYFQYPLLISTYSTYSIYANCVQANAASVWSVYDIKAPGRVTSDLL